MAILAFTGAITVWHVILLMLFQGVVNAFDMPARQAFVIQMVDDRADLPNAIALNSSMVNGGRLLGPAIAGLIIAAAGEAYCFLIDGISYVAVIASLLAMHVPAPAVRRVQKRVMQELVEGWRYVSQSPPIRSILLLLATISLVGMPYTVLMPIFAARILHGGPHTLGSLTACTGVGALVGAVALAGRRTVLELGKVIPISVGIFGAALIAFAFSRMLWVSAALVLAAGFGMMRNMAASNTILQTILEEEKRGRVMAFYAMALAGMSPFGSLIAGAAAAKTGASLTVSLSGALCLIGAGFFARSLPRLRKLIRPIYAELGILPEVATGLQAASSMQTASET
jgi:MFS family permease